MSKIQDPGSFAGPSEHSQQVALFAAVAQYAYKFEKEGKEAYVAFESGAIGADMEQERCERIARALKWFHAVPNGGTRGGDKRSASIAGAQMKAEGAKAGISDTALLFPARGYHGFCIEMKAPGKIKGESAEQKEFGAYLTECGYLYAVFDSWHAALRAIMWYLDFPHTMEWVLPE